MSIADISIKNPVFAWMLMAFLIIFGAISFTLMGVSQMPDIDFPNVSIQVTLEGASPEIMETDVVDVIEDAVMSVEGIREVSSTARQGRATINVEFELERDVDVAVQDLQTKLAQTQQLLPKDIDPPIVSKFNPEDQPIMWLSLSAPVALQDLIEYARDNVKDRFQTIKGVGEVTLGGYVDRNMRVWLKLEELEGRGLTVEDVMAAIKQEHIEVPAGRIESHDREMNVRSVGETPTAAEFRKIIVAYRNGTPVSLDQIAVVEDGLADMRRTSRSMGVPAIGLGIRKQHGANAVDIATRVRKEMDAIRKVLPPGMELNVNFDSTKFIEDSIHEIMFTLGMAILLTSLVCWLFLGSWSSTVNVLLAIPTSIVGTMIIMHFLGFTLNTFTLLALSLSVGIVVDDAIMVLENITRHREKGESKVAAAGRGTREIMFAALASTLALVAIFLPIAFMYGIIGKFLYQFGVTLSAAVLLSLVEAITLTPMRCSQMLNVGERSSRFGRFLDRFFKGLGSGYGRILARCLKWKWAVLGAAAVIFASSLYIAGSLSQELVPPQDQSAFVVRMQTPVGSSLEYTDGLVQECERFIAGRPEAKRYFTIIGGFGGGEVDTATFFVTMNPPGERGPKPVTQQEFQDTVRARLNSFPGLRAYVNDLSLRGLTSQGSSFPVEFAVKGAHWEELAGYSEKIKEKMRESGMVDVNSNYLVGMPEVKIIPDRRRSADLGVSMSSIGTTVNAMIGGVRTGKFKDKGHRYDVRVRLVSDQRSRPEDIKRLFVRNRDGKLVRLSDVVEVKVEPTLQTITRRNRARAITVTAGLPTGKSQKDAMERVQAIAAEVLPPGYVIEFTGTSKLFLEGGLGFFFALGMGMVVAYMILASQFNSYVHPVLVILAMPFSVTGAFLAMYFTGTSFNLYSMIGFVLLMGIVKKNSILLVDFTNQMRQKGMPVSEALQAACPIRLRPILMTSVSTVAAALPAALAWGAGSETMRSMAVVVIGGVAFSTLLTLFVVPCAYAIMPGRVKQAEDESTQPVHESTASSTV